MSRARVCLSLTLRIQVCAKKGIIPIHSHSKDGIGNLIPRSGFFGTYIHHQSLTASLPPKRAPGPQKEAGSSSNHPFLGAFAVKLC